MKILILENDGQIPDYYYDYLKGVKRRGDAYTFVFNASGTDTPVMLEAFKGHERLGFSPTMVTFSQYNMMVMAMYKLLQAGELGIKEIYVFSHFDEIEERLSSLWEGKRMYLDKVLQAVKIYRVQANKEPILLNI